MKENCSELFDFLLALLLLRFYGIDDGLSFGFVAFLRLLELLVHFLVQTGESLLKLLVAQKFKLKLRKVIECPQFKSRNILNVQTHNHYPSPLVVDT